ncbi:phosphoglycerate mutase family protein [Botrytis cinerea]
MPPTLYISRHAKAEHNIKHRFHIPDPILTPRGHTKYRNLRKTFPHHNKIDLILSLPRRRAIQTTLFAFSNTLAQLEDPYLLVPNAQEVIAKPCDTGVSIYVLRAVEIPEIFKEEGLSFGTEKIGFGLVKDEWNSKVGIIFLLPFENQNLGKTSEGFYKSKMKGFYAPDPEAVQARAAALRVWLYGIEAQHVVLVTHGGFLHHLTEDGTVSDPMKWVSHMSLTSSLQNRLITNSLWLQQLRSSNIHIYERLDGRNGSCL